jgi:ribosomal protein S18 acetylase RimI-like enzyme
MHRCPSTVVAVLEDAARNHRSWFGKGRELVELDAVALFLGRDDAVLAFPRCEGDLSTAVRLACESGANEIGCWALAPDGELGSRLSQLGFQDGWEPHWMGTDPRGQREEPGHEVEETAECARCLPYSSKGHESVLGGNVHHFVVREGPTIVGHAVLNVDGESGGIYDMGVAPQARRRGYGRALALAALARAREGGCTSVTLNATGEGEPTYRSVGFDSLGLGKTWWLFPKG